MDAEASCSPPPTQPAVDPQPPAAEVLPESECATCGDGTLLVNGVCEVAPSPPPPPPSPLPPWAGPGVFPTSEALRAAVDEWIDNEAAAEETHGAISGWDTSRVEDLSYLSAGGLAHWGSTCGAGASDSPCPFNGDVGPWDTSRVTTLRKTFNLATSFDRNIGGWDTSKVADMFSTFSGAEAFNSELAWDTSSVTDMRATFFNADAFDQPLGDWDVASATDFDGMFNHAALLSNDCHKSDIYASWGQNNAFAEEYGDWAQAQCDGRRRLSDEAPADAKVDELEATVEAKTKTAA